MQFLPHTRSQKTWLKTIISKEMIVALVLILFPIFYPKIVKAGLFSFITNLTADKASAKTKDIADAPSSQNMTLPRYAVNTDPNPNKTTDLGPIVSGNALAAEIGPSGTISDVESQSNNTQISIYTVRAGDTISKIAQLFDVSPNTILWANNLSKNSALHEGQTLVILPISGIQYTIKKGDTIKSIAKNNNADVDDILNYNDLTLQSSLVAGETIIIPNGELSAPVVVPNSSHPRGPVKNAPYEPLLDNVSNLPSYSGYYARPIAGGRISQELHGHNGVDFAAPVGTPIYAAASGSVIVSRSNGAWNGGYGNFVVISHPNGTQTLYAHMSRTAVSTGRDVSKGEVIGYIGMTGLTTGPHVHFEVRGAKNPF